MKKLLFIAILLYSATTFAQKTALPHGTIYGIKPQGAGMVLATNLERSMGKKITIVTSIKGKVIKVTKEKGGWFTIDAGKGKIIAAHFKSYAVTIPSSLAGHTIVADGVATKQFVADNMQHMAGAKQASSKDNAKQGMKFEVSGLIVE